MNVSPFVSNPLRVMVRPFRGYREIAEPENAPSLPLAALRFMFVLGCFITVSATGRFAPIEMVTAMVSFSWLPIVHALGIALALRLFGRPPNTESAATPATFTRTYALYLEGSGPWTIVFLVLSGSVLFAPQPARPTFVLFPFLILFGTLWSVVLTYALFRSGLALSRARAVGATATFYIAIHVLILGYFFAVGQLWPILPW